MKIKAIVTHKRPHLDEVVAIFLLRTYGTTKYPGIRESKLIFWDAGQKTPDNRPAQLWENEGYLLIGVGGGRLDEHPNRCKDEDKKECAATLVAKDLGIQNDLSLKNLLEFTLLRDTTGIGHFLMFPSLLRLANKSWFDQSPDSVMEWAMQSIALYVNDQIIFFTEAKTDFDKTAKTFTYSHRERKVIVTSVISDSENIIDFTRSSYGSRADVIIKKDSRGNIAITSKNQSRIDFDGVIELLYSEEEKRGKITSKDDSSKPGFGRWYYDRQARRIFNGSLSCSNTPPSSIPLEKIVSLVREGLETSASRNGKTIKI